MEVYKKRLLRNNQICEIILHSLKENNNIIRKEDLITKLKNIASLSTIYRGISRLEKRGLIVVFDVAGDKYIAGTGDREESYSLVFFVCDVCHRIFWLKLSNKALEKIKTKIKELYDFDSKFILYEFHGVCKSCLLVKSKNSLSSKKKEEEFCENSSYANG
ncbi:hypothetical protein [Caldicellulosiruptor morganii]|uniref:Ferric uptake regulator, Fur family n=1 Tax=Caldicellulosiruptor morganii TaxID=1387555 RepID=A0ABY7BQH6_9FIRM|nr:hypothetical protein [Caldicellulosiruptor morganii]WAM34035.1 hypothetical protein OTK00_000184 [Caldicellulosiruptor morganii]